MSKRDSLEKKLYRLSVVQQLASWVDGKPIHNTYADECCPDFSCCRPEMFERDKMKRADQMLDYIVAHKELHV